MCEVTRSFVVVVVVSSSMLTIRKTIVCAVVAITVAGGAVCTTSMMLIVVLASTSNRFYDGQQTFHGQNIQNVHRDFRCSRGCLLCNGIAAAILSFDQITIDVAVAAINDVVFFSSSITNRRCYVCQRGTDTSIQVRTLDVTIVIQVQILDEGWFPTKFQ